jgi:hypothetical protein
MPVALEVADVFRRQHHVPVLASFALLDPDHHPSAIDVTDFEENDFRPAA